MTGSLLGEGTRLVVSLAAVLGLMWLAARVLRRKAGVGGGETVKVLGRTQLARGSAVAIIQVADRALVLGVTEQRVSLLRDEELSAFVTEQPESSAPATRILPWSVPGTRTGQTHLLPAPAGDPADAPVTGAPVAGAPAGISGQPAPQLPRPQGTGALQGSVLSPRTWRQTVDVLRERSVRRG